VLRKQRATYAPVARPAANGDRVTVDFTGTLDGVEFPGGQAKDFAIMLGEGRMLPEFEAAVAGMSAGETRTFPLTFPADYHGKEVAGRTASFALTAKEVSETRLPPLDSAFATAFGIASGDVVDLRAEVEQNLKLELKRKIEGAVKEQVLKGLRAKAEFAVPSSLVDMEATTLMQRMAQNLQQQGMKAEDVKLSPDLFRPQAEDRVVLGLVLNELVRAEGLGARPEQVKALVTELAQTYEQPDAVVRWHYEKPERLNEFEAQVAEKNVVDWVLSKARVVDQPTTFDALMSPAARGA
jgi:trigger factor